jgi:predicted RNA-binding protein with PIN domain
VPENSSPTRGARIGFDPGLRASWRDPLAGVGRTLVAIAAMLGFGLGFAGLEIAARNLVSPPTPYPRVIVPEAPAADPIPNPAESEPRIWLVDGFNVLHAGVLKGRDRAGWWKAEAQLRLVRRVERFSPADVELIVVFDDAREHSERCEAPASAPRLTLVFAPSADDWLVRTVRKAKAPQEIAVVTGDRQVQGRVRHAGARVVSPRAFLARCPTDGESLA